ncbi:MAG: cytochrome C [Desulfobacteraceae bacterium]|nr:MAG: cytochrome C [Desulfobacteraceae bacterium]
MIKNRQAQLKWLAFLVILTLFCVFAAGAQDSGVQNVSSPEPRADILPIDAMDSFGELERPKVHFLHDRHTDALEKKGKDCLTCHLTEKDRLSPKFKRLVDGTKNDVMDIYHSECMACHKQAGTSGEKTGPVESCGECHREADRWIDSRVPMGFDQSLHYRHTRTTEDKCELCHHQYDDIAKKLVYPKEKEDSCRYCHKQETQGNRISMRQASHDSCIDCHKKTLEKALADSAVKKKAGPVKCSGCHDPKRQDAIEKVRDVPRLKRNQPDVVLLQFGRKEPPPAGTAESKMNPVPFNHKEHEKYNTSCSVCHHASLESCSSLCHTPAGSKLGKQINLERAMHQLGTKASCMGCHESRVRDKKCAGCHSFIEKGREFKQSTCTQCHTQPQEGAVKKPEAAAAMLLQSRKTLSTTGTYRDEDIPEKVLIRELSDIYEPVEFPHRRIVHALIGNIKSDKLADVFHSQTGAICQGCHHHSPESPKPPSCRSCHGRPFDEKNPQIPGITAAYHQQCMGCHREMEITKPSAVSCTECHKAKSPPGRS